MTTILPPLVPTLDEVRSLPTMTDPAWRDPATVWEIAVHRYWRHVDAGGHTLAHPRPVFGCPGCPQSEACPRCALPAPECPDPFEHRRAWAGSEATWREAAA